MNIYQMIGNNIGTTEAVDLADRLASWHDAMVTHERLQALRGHSCDDECAHATAAALWREAVTTFGGRSSELRFLESRARQLAAAKVRS